MAKSYADGRYNLANDVENKLAERGFNFVKEANFGIYTIDYWVPEHSIGIEVDGPSHFLAPMMQPSGST